VSDGGVGVNVRIQRNAGLFSPQTQRVYVNFEGGTAVAAGGLPATNIPPLRAQDFNQFFTVDPSYADADTEILQQVIMQTIRGIYANFNIEFVGSNESDEPPALPYKTMYVGGTAPGNILLGISDYVNPRNDTQTGTGIAYALTIGALVIDNGALVNPPLSGNPAQALTNLGIALGNVAAHECGHMMGLRHTSEPGDLMQSEGTNAGDPTATLSLKVGTPAAGEQIDILEPLGVPDVPPIGQQNAPQYLSEVVGGG
jgi:hypothetical protein